jgi:hypothetical protein
MTASPPDLYAVEPEELCELLDAAWRLDLILGSIHDDEKINLDEDTRYDIHRAAHQAEAIRHVLEKVERELWLARLDATLGGRS